MAAPGVSEQDGQAIKAPASLDSLSKEEPLPPGKAGEPKPDMLSNHIDTDIKNVISDNNNDTVKGRESLPISNGTLLADHGADQNGVAELIDDDYELHSNPLVMVESPKSDSSESNLTIDSKELSIGSPCGLLPLVPELTNSLVRIAPAPAPAPVMETTQLLEPLTKPPFKGVMVPCGKLKEYLDSLPTFNRKCMLRKGREVHKIYVDMTKGECFLDDQFAYTEFGKMVLGNGSIRAGRAKNVKQIVVARETLYCSGTSACKRACGAYGICVPGCDKTKMRGHRCAYRIKLTQRLGFVNFWFVEELGSHDQLSGKDADFKTNSQHVNPSFIPASVKYQQSTSACVASIVNSVLDLSPKKEPSPCSDVDLSSSVTNSPRTKESHVNSDSVNAKNAEDQPNYHYVLGLMPTSSPSQESPSRVSPVPASVESHQEPAASIPSTSQQFSAIELYRNLVSQAAMSAAAAAQQVAGAVNPSISSQVTAVTPTMPVGVINYMPDMSGLNLQNLQAIQNALNPVLVNIKQEPQDHESQSQGLTQGQLQSQLQALQSHGQLLYPVSLPVQQVQYAPARISKSHSPSPSRGQGQREKSPFVQKHAVNAGLQKGLEIEHKIKNEATRKMQAQQEILGQVQSRIMERAKSRKSAQTVRVAKQPTPERDNMSTSKAHTDLSDYVNIPKVFSATESNNNESSPITKLAFNRFQTLNRILQSEAFQAAKSQLESRGKNKTDINGDQSQEVSGDQQDGALNLTIKDNKLEPEPGEMVRNHSSYFKLIEEWKQGGQLQGLPEKDENVPNGEDMIEDATVQLATVELSTNEKELMCRVRQLESHVKQLQNIVIKRDGDGNQPGSSRRKKAQREFDFSKYNTRHVALKVLYLGCDYQGFATQEDSERTIEHVLFDALKKTRLIESRETSSYHRCGRTDKGVSAFGQVISIDLRSNLISGVGVKVKEGGTANERPGDKTHEIRYCHILNKVLPPEIRVLAWAPVDPEFSASNSENDMQQLGQLVVDAKPASAKIPLKDRILLNGTSTADINFKLPPIVLYQQFSCKKRTYKYMFPRGSLDVQAMDTAVQKLLGERDYRNLCKMDVANGVTNFTRRILSAGVVQLDDGDSGYNMCELTIIGSSFLWHQIRCIVAVLFLIGQGKENPEIFDELLDVEKTPRKPQYTMASEIPLCLYDAEFGDDFEWIYEADWHEENIKNLQQLWASHAVKATMLKRMLEDLDRAKVETECDIAPWSDLSPPVLSQGDWLLPGHKPRVYKPLLERPTCDSLEDRMEHYAKKRKLNTGAEEPTAVPATSGD